MLAILNVGAAPLSKTVWPLLFAAATVVAVGAAAMISARRQPRLFPLAADSAGAGFLFGAGIYCGTFLLGGHYAYRMIFLLLTLPQLLTWSDAGSESPTRRVARVLFASLVSVLWLGLPLTVQIVPHLANWALFAMLGYVLAYMTLRNTVTKLRKPAM